MPILDDFGVDRQPEHGWRILSRDVVVDLLLISVYGIQIRYFVLEAGGFVLKEIERFACVEEEVAKLLVEVCIEYASVPVV